MLNKPYHRATHDSNYINTQVNLENAFLVLALYLAVSIDLVNGGYFQFVAS